jgi:protein O-mannosyl-transferase
LRGPEGGPARHAPSASPGAIPPATGARLLAQAQPALQNALLLGACLLIAFLAYRPGLSGDFVFDDQANILENDSLDITRLDGAHLWQAAWSGDSGPLKRPVSMVSFALNRYFYGLDPFAFKTANVLLHLLTGVAVYVFVLLVLRAYRRHDPHLDTARERAIALTTSAAWLLHPLNVSTVLYVVQRMAVLSALFTLAGLSFYLRGRERLEAGSGSRFAMTACVLGCTALATLSKENGALLPLYLVVLEWVLYGFRSRYPATQRFLNGFFFALVVLPCLLAALVLASGDYGWAQGYGSRDFSLGERLMTEARAIWLYISLVLVPDISRMGLFHDDFPISHGLLDPPTTLAALAGLAGFLAGAWAARCRAPLLTLGVLFFLVGHGMESTFLPLEPVFEHRNYLPSLGLLLPAAYLLLRAGPVVWMRAQGPLVLALLTALTLGTAARAGDWGNPLLLALAEEQNHPASPRAAYEVGKVYANLIVADPAHANEYYRQARQYYERATALDGHFADGLFGLVAMSAYLHRPPEPDWFTALETRLARPPLAAASPNWIGRLVQGQIRHNYDLSPEHMDALFGATLGNPAATGHQKAAVLSAAAAYYGLYRGDLDRALGYARAAVKHAPDDIPLRLGFARLLAAAGRLQAARAQMQSARMRDRWGVHALLIAAAEGVLESRPDLRRSSTRRAAD